MNRPPVPATPFFRDVARNPYDAHALAARFGGSWYAHINHNTHLHDAPGAGWRYMVELGDQRMGLLMRNWRNAR